MMKTYPPIDGLSVNSPLLNIDVLMEQYPASIFSTSDFCIIFNLGISTTVFIQYSVLWCYKSMEVVFVDVTGKTLTLNCSLFPSAYSRNTSLDPKDPLLSDFFSCWPQSYQYVCLLTLPNLSVDTQADSECWLLLAAQLSWTFSRTLYCNTVIFRQADANKYL